MTENVIVEFEDRLKEFSKSEQWRRLKKKIFATRRKKLTFVSSPRK